MIVSFNDEGTEDVYNGKNTKAAWKTCPEQIWRVATRKLDYLRRATRIQDLASPPGNMLEPLYGDRLGQHSIRINSQYRVCFRWTPEGPADVEIVDYHK